MTQRLQMISVTDPNIHNIALDGKPDSIPPDTVMFFEADAGWNAAGGMELIGKGDAGHPDNGGTIIVGYVDGSVHQIRRSQLGSLRWKP